MNMNNFWTRSRIISFVMVALDMFAELIFVKDHGLLLMYGCYLFISIVCIWFGDGLGAWEGVAAKGYIRKTPGSVMKVGGWVLLFLPIVLGLIHFFQKP